LKNKISLKNPDLNVQEIIISIIPHENQNSKKSSELILNQGVVLPLILIQQDNKKFTQSPNIKQKENRSKSISVSKNSIRSQKQYSSINNLESSQSQSNSNLINEFSSNKASFSHDSSSALETDKSKLENQNVNTSDPINNEFSEIPDLQISDYNIQQQIRFGTPHPSNVSHLYNIKSQPQNPQIEQNLSINLNDNKYQQISYLVPPKFSSQYNFSLISNEIPDPPILMLLNLTDEIKLLFTKLQSNSSITNLSTPNYISSKLSTLSLSSPFYMIPEFQSPIESQTNTDNTFSSNFKTLIINPKPYYNSHFLLDYHKYIYQNFLAPYFNSSSFQIQTINQEPSTPTDQFTFQKYSVPQPSGFFNQDLVREFINFPSFETINPISFSVHTYYQYKINLTIPTSQFSFCSQYLQLSVTEISSPMLQSSISGFFRLIIIPKNINYSSTAFFSQTNEFKFNSTNENSIYFSINDLPNSEIHLLAVIYQNDQTLLSRIPAACQIIQVFDDNGIIIPLNEFPSKWFYLNNSSFSEVINQFLADSFDSLEFEVNLKITLNLVSPSSSITNQSIIFPIFSSNHLIPIPIISFFDFKIINSKSKPIFLHFFKLYIISNSQYLYEYISDASQINSTNNSIYFHDIFILNIDQSFHLDLIFLFHFIEYHPISKMETFFGYCPISIHDLVRTSNFSFKCLIYPFNYSLTDSSKLSEFPIFHFQFHLPPSLFPSIEFSSLISSQNPSEISLPNSLTDISIIIPGIYKLLMMNSSESFSKLLEFWNIFPKSYLNIIDSWIFNEFNPSSYFYNEFSFVVSTSISQYISQQNENFINFIIDFFQLIFDIFLVSIVASKSFVFSSNLRDFFFLSIYFIQYLLQYNKLSQSFQVNGKVFILLKIISEVTSFDNIELILLHYFHVLNPLRENMTFFHVALEIQFHTLLKFSLSSS
jgi:hypothetical protein